MFIKSLIFVEPEQECIPVGCVPAARRLYAGVCSGGVSALEVSGPGGGLVPGGVCSGGSVPGGSALGGCLVREGGSPCRSTPPPPPWTESQTPVKTLPWPNFVAAGNESLVSRVQSPPKGTKSLRIAVLKYALFLLTFSIHLNARN